MTNQQEQSLREKIAEVAGMWFFAQKHHANKWNEMVPDVKELWLGAGRNMTDNILSLILAEIDKAELTDEEILESTTITTFKEDGTIDFNTGYLTGRKQVARAQLDKVKRML